jgi:hypothetical protein
MYPIPQAAVSRDAIIGARGGGARDRSAFCYGRTRPVAFAV